MLYFGRWKLLSIFLVCALGILFALPNFVPENQRYETAFDGSQQAKGVWRYLPSRSVNLGLDLQGGSHIVYEVDMSAVRRERLDRLANEVMQSLQEQPRLPAVTPAVVGEDVIVRLARPEDRDTAYDRLRALATPVNAGLGPAGPQSHTVTRDDDDPRALRLSITEAMYENIREQTLVQSIEVIRNRLDGMGTTDPTIARTGNSRIMVQVPGESDPDRINALVQQQARLTFHMVAQGVDPGPEGAARVPPNVMTLPGTQPGEWYAIERLVRLDGDNLNRAWVSSDPGYPVVNFQFDTTGAAIFSRITSDFTGQRFAIVLDELVISAPRINTPILGGTGYIEGGFTFETAQELQILLNAGSLPAQLTAVEQRTVGASLGQDQIESGTMAILIGFVAVIVFMIAAYGLFGVFSNVSLLVNIVLILGGLSLFGLTLTLPGIAGIILTIGMAVDANVLIFERIREESRANRKLANAIETGFASAWSAIRDANITTMIAAMILYSLGAGPVRGFALTLGIGILTSVFTAFVVSRLLIVFWLRWNKPKSLPI